MVIIEKNTLRYQIVLRGFDVIRQVALALIREIQDVFNMAWPLNASAIKGNRRAGFEPFFIGFAHKPLLIAAISKEGVNRGRKREGYGHAYLYHT